MWHVLKIDGLAILSSDANITIPCIVPETVLDTNNNPGEYASELARHYQNNNKSTHQRFVNTTPKPKATKKSRGEEPEFPPPPPLLLPLPLSPVLVDVGMGSDVKVEEAEEKPVEEGARLDDAVGSDEALVNVLETCLTWRRRVRAARSTNSWPPRAMTTILRTNDRWDQNNVESISEVS